MQSSQHADTGTGARTDLGHVVVVGGGITGLAAAHRLIGAGVDVTLVESTDRLGGKLLTGEIAGAPVDLGAESLLARRPEAIALARAVGLGDRLQPPATATASLWTRDTLRPMPKGHVMGVPGTPEALAGLLSPAGVARIAQERELPPAELGDDVAIGAFTAERLGHEVVDRLVEPLLGGVYAGNAYRISMRAAVPQLFAAAKEQGTLLGAVQEVQRRAQKQQPGGPVFLGIEGGVGTLPGAVADAVRAGGCEILRNTPVHALSRRPGGWEIRTADRAITADAVVLAVPAGPAGALLAPESPAAATELGRIEYASMALVTLAFRRSELIGLPAGSGFLVPPVDGRTIKASTFSSQKWQWVSDRSPDLFVLRASIGRHGEEEPLEHDDAHLTAVARHDLQQATGVTANPVAAVVTRWNSGLPQYPVGHLSRIARIHQEIAKLPGLVVCGAAYDGVGIPACIAGGQRAAEEILATHTLTQGTRQGTGQ
ncbi:protoporphyrinogen oxidase [Streptomyces albipurpureus]|uniref:Coproporphyrinogen III oxidase n=1 Tax=Streptomyces albipurpureus TaxID=2897419 RepID=A0ABT0UID2_9ACTN|nr:protoporphyrinogen oxidase [Streptomyces sp. CWNU-1]MCM2387071.1 protoporphyrinogen oxidase [Streptomyces sp. CWNU-1]